MPNLKIGLIGGTGLGDALGATTGATRHELDTLQTPFGPPSDAILETEWAGVNVLILPRHGPGHLHNPSQVPFRANVFALKTLGCTHIIASGATGSLRDEMRPKDLVIPDQIIDKTHRRAGTFFDKAAVHVEFAEPFCPVMRQILLEAGRELTQTQPTETVTPQQVAPVSTPSFNVHERGCYVCMEGPAFSTRAESIMHRLWGGDLIGMTAMPEAKLAKEAEISYALVALVTDYDCWRQPPTRTQDPQTPHHDPFLLLKEIMGNLKTATEHAVSLMRRAVEIMATRRPALEACPAQHALQLAIWSDKARIPDDEVQRLGPLWMKYFEQKPAPVPPGDSPVEQVL